MNLKNLITSFIGGLLVAVVGFPMAYEQYHSPGKSSDTAVLVNNLGSPVTNIPTYSYQLKDFTPASTPTDVLCLSGSSQRVLKVNRVQLTLDANSASMLDIYVYKRTAVNTGGTASAVAAVPLDSANPTSVASAVVYTANPSAVGTGQLMAADHYEIPASTGNSFFGGPWIEDFGVRNSQALVLRGPSESLCFNLAGQSLPAGLSVYTRFEWTEE